MKESIQHILDCTVPLFSQKWLIRLTGVPTILPFYHTVSDKDLPHLKHLYPVLSQKSFERQLDYLLKYYQPADYHHLFKEQPAKGNFLVLTFDDGLRQFYDIAAPILLRKGIPAICFVNTGFIDNKAMFYRMKTSLLIEHLLKQSEKSMHTEVRNRCESRGIDYRNPGDLKKITDSQQSLLDELGELTGTDFDVYLREHRPYLSSEQLMELRKQGFAIGAHSVTHPYFPGLSEKEQIRETLESVREVKARFGMEDGLFSFPYTDFEIRKSFFEAIKPEVKLSFGTANLKNDCIPSNF